VLTDSIIGPTDAMHDRTHAIDRGAGVIVTSTSDTRTRANAVAVDTAASIARTDVSANKLERASESARDL
jgi:hypothetical protein